MATILIEEQEIPSDLVHSTVTSFADQRIQVISQRIMSRANLIDIIKKFDLYADDIKTKTEERILEKMRKSIKVETISADVIDPRNGQPTKATIAFVLSFDNTSAPISQKVTNELVSLFLKENIKTRTESADNAALFLSEESRRLKEKIKDIQNKLADFKEKNLNQLPEANQLNQQELTALNNQLIESGQPGTFGAGTAFLSGGAIGANRSERLGHQRGRQPGFRHEGQAEGIEIAISFPGFALFGNPSRCH